MSLLAALRAARAYSVAEATRLASFGQLPEVIPDFSGLPAITFREGHAHLLIDPRHQPRTFDVPVAFVLKLFEAFGGNLLLNSRERRGGNARAYVRADIGESHTYVNRVIMDVSPGLVVREVGNNFRSHLPEDLVVRDAPLRDGPTKHVNGRPEFVAALLDAYDRADFSTHNLIPRDDLEQLLLGLLALADARASERAINRSLAKVAPAASTMPGAAE